MNKRFFNQQNLTRRLRMLSVLFAMLLMPIGAWAENYPLIVAGVQVTDANKGNVLGDDETATVVFTPANNTVSPATPATLTLSGATINGIITYSGTKDLTIAFSGTNSVSTPEDHAIQYVGSGSELPNLAFSLTNGSTTGSLNISSENSVLYGFSDVDFGNLNLASTNAQGVYYNSSDYYMAGCGGNPNDLTITTDKYYPIWIYDPSLWNTGYPYTQLRGESTITINDNSENPGTVSFDGDHTITINKVYFNYESNNLIVVGPSMPQLTVDLVGESTGGDATNILNLWNTTPLTFTTDKTNPGSLAAPSIILWSGGSGQISYENGLVFNYDTSTTYTETISTTGVRIKISKSGDPEVIYGSTDENGLFGGTVFFDASNNTLTLKGATLGNIDSSFGIQVFVDDLKVVISGENTILGDITYAGNSGQSSSIQINKAEGATSPSLTMSNIEQFGSCTWGDGLYLSANDGNGKSVDVGYEFEDGEGAFRSYYGSIAEVTISTIPSNPLWINGIQATGGSVRGTGIAKIDFGEVGESEWDITFTPSTDTNPNTLLLKNVEITISNDQTPAIISGLDNLIIQIEGSSSINFHGSYGGYIISSTNPAATLTFKANETNSQLATNISSSDYIGSPSNGFAETSYENGLMWIAHGTSTQNIINPVPTITTNNIWMPEYVDGMSLVYSVNYENDDETTQNITNATYNSGQSLDIDLGKPCTVTAHVEYGSLSSTTATAKYFGPAEDPMRLVYGADPVDLVLAPTIEESDGIKINGIEANVTYNSTTGKVSSENMGSHGAVVTLTNTGETVKTILLNNYFSMSFDVVPPAPTITPDGGTLAYDQTITLSLPEGCDANIKYKWDNGDEQSYTAPIEVQTGTLTAWAVLTQESANLLSDEVTATFTKLLNPNLRFTYIWQSLEYGNTFSQEVKSDMPTTPTVTWSSSNEAVATVDPNTGVVTPVAPSNSDIEITATFAGDDTYAPATASYAVSVVKGTQYLFIQYKGESTTLAKARVTKGKTLNIKENYNLICPEELVASLTWTPDNATIATVADGVVSGVNCGNTRIVVASAGNDNYEEDTYEFYVDVAPLAPTIELETGTYLSTHAPITITKENIDGTSISYTWDDITGDNNAEWTAYTDAGVTLQTGTLSAMVGYYDAENYNTIYSDTVSVAYTVFVDPEMQFIQNDEPVDAAEYIIGAASNPALPTLDNPNNVAVTYASNNTDVATVAADGTVTVVGIGEATITATSAATDVYAAGEASYTLTVKRQLDVSFSETNEWATYYGTESLAIPTGLKAYQVTAVDGSTVTIEEISYIPANTAVLLKNVSNNNTWSNIAASAYTGATSTFASNKLIGTASDVDVSTISGGTVYVLYNNMFKRATGGTIPANRGYLVVEPSAVNAGNAPQLSISIGDDTTGIQTLNVERGTLNDDSWYTIDGRKVNGQSSMVNGQLKPGLYIKNGKKVVINKK